MKTTKIYMDPKMTFTLYRLNLVLENLHWIGRMNQFGLHQATASQTDDDILAAMLNQIKTSQTRTAFG